MTLGVYMSCEGARVFWIMLSKHYLGKIYRKGIRKVLVIGTAPKPKRLSTSDETCHP